ncbi:MAG: hypothetical protein JW768_05370 [Chitinispirillaceae bacterium]|nr:hypothetical protein [Chitinispirillaceae bacterium]
MTLVPPGSQFSDIHDPEIAKDDGKVVWELRMPREHGADYGIYCTERVYPPPLVRPIGK